MENIKSYGVVVAVVAQARAVAAPRETHAQLQLGSLGARRRVDSLVRAERGGRRGVASAVVGLLLVQRQPSCGGGGAAAGSGRAQRTATQLQFADCTPSA